MTLSSVEPADGSTTELLWVPTSERVKRAAITDFREWLAGTRGLDLPDYQALWQWSVDEPAIFWGAVWDYFEVAASRPYDFVLRNTAMPGTEWFTGAWLNYAENTLQNKPDERVAIIRATEHDPPREITWGELRADVARAADGLRRLGVGQGDRVVAVLPNIPETVVAFLATVSIGAVWSCAAPEFGVATVVDRFAQVEPTVLIVSPGYSFGGHDFDRSEQLEELRGALPTLQHTVVIRWAPLLGPEPRDTIDWTALLGSGPPPELSFTQVPFDHPLWILYSSGTTGLPKAIVHSHGGILLEYLVKLHLHVDAQEGDRIFWFTTTGWVMWNYLIGVLLTDAAVILYDGSPRYPDLNVLWDLAEATRMTCFGTSAGYIEACMKARLKPAAGRDLSCLTTVGSTASPLSADAFRWVYEELGPDVWLFSSSGGTDTATALVGGCPVLPVYAGEIQARQLGCSVEAYDDEGRSVVDRVGELVVTKPMPSMPLYFWNDPGDVRYRESYFETFPGVWRQGDWIRITPRGSAIIYGRSDSTINRGGIRMGTNEIYRAVLSLEAVEDALVVDLPRPGNRLEMILFVALRSGMTLTDELVSALAAEIREKCSPRHVPDQVLQVPAIPLTLTGKRVEVPVKRLLMGMDDGRAINRDALANPDALDALLKVARAEAGS